MILRSHTERAGAVRDSPKAEAVASEAARAFILEHRSGGLGGNGLAVVLAAFDEEDSIGGVLGQIAPRIAELDVECIVVDDGSDDRTSAVAAKAGALVCRLGENLGQGRALRVGYLLARSLDARFIVTLDADGQHDPAEIAGLVAPLLDGQADFVNGSRILGRSYTTDRFRALGLTFFGRLVTLLTGVPITDPANGFRGFTCQVAAEVPLRQPQYQTTELLIGAIESGFTVMEVPVTVLPRAQGESKKGRNLAYGARFARTILVTWLRFRIPGRGRRRPRSTG
jgi:hypothetical protein